MSPDMIIDLSHPSTIIIYAYNSQIQMQKNKRANKDQPNKERNQRILHIYSTQGTYSDSILKAATLPLKKNAKLSANQPQYKSKELSKKQKAKGHASTVKIKPPEIYQRIAVNIANSNTNSQIEFSNYGETLKEGIKPFRKQLYIDCDERTLMKQIWALDRKKIHVQNEAATKIQKVFRGFMTRKLLQKYIQEYEGKLQAEIRQIKRKNTYLTNHEDSFYDCELKHSYFLSNRKSLKKSRIFNSEDKASNLDLESSIRENQPYAENFISIQQSDIAEKLQKERKSSLPDRSSLTLNESSINQQAPEISLSFGYEIEHSPHFIHPQPPKKSEEERVIAQSPNDKIVKAGHSQDNTRDAISQNLTVSPNYYKRNRSDKSESHLTSLLREQSQDLAISGKKVEKLKSSEKAKWQQVIEFLNENIKGNFDYEKTKQIMCTILQFSLKNREELSEISHIEPQSVTVTDRPELNFQFSKDQIDRNFKKKKWQQDIILQKSIKNENMPLSRDLKPEKSILQRTCIMKEHFLKNMYISDGHIDKMMQFRETMLRKKEADSLRQLNYLLENNLLTQDEFLDRLSKLTISFHTQKKDIQQTKQDIYKGYKAQLQLIKNAAIDARYLGYNIPFCRSMEIFPHQPRWRFDDLMIDELNQMASRKFRGTKEERSNIDQSRRLNTQQINNLMEEQPPEQTVKQLCKSPEREVFEESSSEEEQIDCFKQTPIYNKFTYSEDNLEEEKQLPVLSPKKMKQVSPFAKFSAIAVFEAITPHEMRPLSSRQQDAEQSITQPLSLESSGRQLKKETYKLSAESSEEEDQIVLYKEAEQKKTQEITDFSIKKIIWEVIEDICSCPKLLKVFTAKNKKKAIQPIATIQKTGFLRECLGNLPNFQVMKRRINQKMYPNIKQLLYSMRECDYEDQQSEYIEIGQYQYILNQEICFNLIQHYLEKYRHNRQLKLDQSRKLETPKEFKQEYLEFSSEGLRRLCFQQKLESEKISKYMEEYRQEVLRIELHMIFDVWNEELIKYRQNKNGYSGIGLNQITLCMADRVCKEMKTQEEYKLMMVQTATKIQERLRAEGQSELMYEDQQEKICRNNSQWILYTQQALQYGFDLIRIIQLQLIFQFLNQIQRFDFEQSKQKLSESMVVREEQQSSLLNSQQQFRIEKKMLQMDEQAYSDSDDSFYS